MALSADTPRAFELGNQNTFPVAGNAKIYEGAAVGDNSSGYARALMASDAFRGFALRQADNSASATDGAINVTVVTEGKAELTITGIAITDVGKPAFASDDGTFTLTSDSNSKIGWVHRYVGTNRCIVAFSAEPEDMVTDSRAASLSTVIASNLSTGNSKAASLAALVSTADSKAVSNSVVISTLDSKIASAHG